MSRIDAQKKVRRTVPKMNEVLAQRGSRIILGHGPSGTVATASANR